MEMFVIAGNVNEYQNWLFHLKKTTNYRSNYRYVGVPDILRGIENPHGVFIGTWYNRKDIHEILERLVVSSRVDNPGLNKAIEYYRSRKDVSS